jgi:hypothetical protein
MCSDLVPDISEQSVHENRIYSVNIHCGDDYPDAPPTIQFVSKVNLPCVDPRTGKVSSAGHGLGGEHFTDKTLTGRPVEGSVSGPVEERLYYGDDPG